MNTEQMNKPDEFNDYEQSLLVNAAMPMCAVLTIVLCMTSFGWAETISFCAIAGALMYVKPAYKMIGTNGLKAAAAIITGGIAGTVYGAFAKMVIDTVMPALIGLI